MDPVEIEQGINDNGLPTEEAYQRVQEWLKILYNGNNIPNFEVNEATVNILYKIMNCNLTSDRQAKELIKNRLHLVEWYISEGDKTNDALFTAGLKLNEFPKLCQEAVNSVGMAACTLDLKDPSPTSFLLCLNALSREQSISSRKKSAQLCLSSKLSSKLNSILLKTQCLQRDLQNAVEAAKAQAQQEGKREKQTMFLQSKQEEYCRTKKKLEDKLILSSGDDSIYHQTLVKKSEELKILKDELDDVTAKLSSYQNLPPNENLVRLKIEESKEELFQLEKELQMNICSK